MAGAGSDVGGDNDERVWVGCVPYTLLGQDFSWREGEFGVGGKGQEGEEKEKGGGDHGYLGMAWFGSSGGWQSALVCSQEVLSRRSKNRRQRHEAPASLCLKKKEMCFNICSSTATLCVPQLNPNTLSPDTAALTSVEDVVNEDQCVLILSVLGSDSGCTMLNIQ